MKPLWRKCRITFPAINFWVLGLPHNQTEARAGIVVLVRLPSFDGANAVSLAHTPDGSLTCGAREHAAWSRPVDRILSACCRTRCTPRRAPFRVRRRAHVRRER